MTRWTRTGIATIAMLAAACLSGCATPPPPAKARTTVVLLPDEDGNVGAVSVTTSGGTQRIDEAFSYSTVDGTASAPANVKAMGQPSVDATYSALMKAQPHKPKSFVLHFLLDKTVLTEESKAMLPAVLEAARQRKPTVITVFGHADSSGTEERNNKLSADRAKLVADLLRKHDPALGQIEVQYFGDKAPLVQSDSRSPEPRNRRAEIMIL